MHIIIDGTTTQDQFAYAGVGQCTKNLILSLVKNHPNTQYSILLFENKDSLIEPEINKYENAKIERTGKFRKNDYKNDIWYFFQILPKINKIKQKDSIYFCPYFWRNFPAFSMPTILFVHDMNLALFNMYSQQSIFHNIIRGVQYWVTLYKAKRCRYIITNSETTKRDFLSYFPKYPEEKITVSHLASDLEMEEADLSDILPKDYKDKGYIIYMGGGINKTKNTEGVIRGYSEFLKLLNPNENAPYLVIAGTIFIDKSKKEVRGFNRLIQALGIKDKVVFTGFYKDEQKYSLLINSFAFIHLSAYEGFGIAPLEAVLAETPCIIHRSNVYQEVFKDMAIFVNGENSVEVGKTIYDVYKNQEKYKKITEKAYKLSKKYDWRKTGDTIHEVFERLRIP